MEGSSYYIIIPAPVKTSKILSAYAKLLFGEIAVKCNVKGYCWATNNYFAEVFDCNVRSIQRYIKELEDANFIAVELIEDEQKGTSRKITATILSQHPATVLSQPPTTEQSPVPATEPTPPHDTEDAPPHDTAVTHIINTDLLLKENNKIENNNTGGDGKKDLFGDPEKPINGKRKKEKPGSPAPEIKLPWPSPEFSAAWDNWKQYRSGEHNFKYKTPQSQQAALNDLCALADGLEIEAITLINHAMAKGWKGLYKKHDNGQQTNNNVKNGNYSDRSQPGTDAGDNSLASRISANNEKYGF